MAETVADALAAQREQQWAEIFARAARWQDVGSSNVGAIRWQVGDVSLGATQGDFALGTLYVRFNDGAVYAYSSVALRVFRDFEAAPSKGKFVWQRLRDKFAYAKVS